MALPKLVAVVGANASGKSSLGVALARAFDGEIVSADSRQVFRGLDLGSGKITPEEAQGVIHHLIDAVEPDTFFSMYDFQTPPSTVSSRAAGSRFWWAARGCTSPRSRRATS